MLAEFLLGEITFRKFRVLIEHLPEGSALHRAKYEGRTWTSQHALLWTIAQLLMVRDAHAIQIGGGKAKTPTWREFPWTKTAERVKRTLGQRGRLTDEQVKKWLDAMRPASQQ